MALILSILLTYRLRTSSSSLTLLSLSNKVHALPTELNFYTTTTTSLSNHDFTISTELICDIIIMGLLAALVFLFIFWLYRKRHLFKFDLYVYIGNQTRCHSIWVRSFWLEPALYTFTATKYIENISLDGCFSHVCTLIGRLWTYDRMLLMKSILCHKIFLLHGNRGIL